MKKKKIIVAICSLLLIGVAVGVGVHFKKQSQINKATGGMSGYILGEGILKYIA